MSRDAAIIELFDAMGAPVSAPQFQAAVDAAAHVLEHDGVIVVPTDTVYGVAASMWSSRGVARLFALKDRPTANPLAVLVADIAQAKMLADVANLSPDAQRRIEEWMTRFWPGALTIVVPRSQAVAGVDLGGPRGDDTAMWSTIGVRCPASPIVRALAARVGPIVATSANRSGTPTPRAAAEAARGLAGSVDLIVDGGPCTESASTVADMTCTPPRLVRVGPISQAQLGGEFDGA